MTPVVVEPVRRNRALRPSTAVATALGSVSLLLGLHVFSWFVVSGRNQVSSASQIPTDATGIYNVVNPHAGQQHGTIMWLLVAATILLALVAQLPARPLIGVAARFSAVAFALLTSITTALQVWIAGVAVGDIHLTVTPSAGFWMTLIALAVLGLAAAIGPRTSSTSRS